MLISVLRQSRALVRRVRAGALREAIRKSGPRGELGRPRTAEKFSEDSHARDETFYAVVRPGASMREKE